jgi:hypothetical protein
MYFVTSTEISIYMPASPIFLLLYVWTSLLTPRPQSFGRNKGRARGRCGWGLVLASDGQGRCTVAVIRTASLITSRAQFRTDSR